MSKKILMILAPENFRDEEYQIPREIFEKEAFQVTVASSRLGMARGKYGLTAPVDLLLASARATEYDAVVFVGGAGSRDYFENPKAHQLAREALQSDRLLCAICSAPGTLAKAGLLREKKATSYETEAELLKAGGAIFTGRDVEQDGRIITGSGPQASEAFARSIVEALRLASLAQGSPE